VVQVVEVPEGVTVYLFAVMCLAVLVENMEEEEAGAMPQELQLVKTEGQVLVAQSALFGQVLLVNSQVHV
jgi:hypothetical protein